MKLIPRIVALLLLAALGFWGWQTLNPSPETVITRELRRIAHAASLRPGEGTIPRLAGAQTVGGFLSDSLEINIDIPGQHERTTMTRDDIMQALMARQGGAWTLEFLDINVSIGADGQTAVADVTVEARTAGDPDLMIQQMKITFRKINGHWLITRVETVRTFSMRHTGLSGRRASAIKTRRLILTATIQTW